MFTKISKACNVYALSANFRLGWWGLPVTNIIVSLPIFIGEVFWAKIPATVTGYTYTCLDVLLWLNKYNIYTNITKYSKVTTNITFVVTPPKAKATPLCHCKLGVTTPCHCAEWYAQHNRTQEKRSIRKLIATLNINDTQHYQCCFAK
jgi:hypothetical protein